MSVETENIDFTKVRIKEEKLSPPREIPKEQTVDAIIPKLFDSSSKPAEDTEHAEEKKSVEPIKSSNEILAELFRVFNATPPKSLLNDEFLLEKKKKKHKERKHKKKSKKRSRDNSEEEFTSDEEKKNKKKKKKHKKHKKDHEQEASIVKTKQEKPDEKDKNRPRSKEPTPPLENKTSDISDFVISSEDEGGPPRMPQEPIVIKREKDASPKPARGKIVIKNLKNSQVLQEAAQGKNKGKKDPNREDGELSDLTLSDEETYLRERNDRARNGHSGRNKDHWRHTGNHRRFRDRSRERPSERWRSSGSRSRFRRRSRSRSGSRRSEGLDIDKQYLLQIARKNAISMFRNGSLPGTQSMPQEVKNKVLMKMRYGGKTVEELTEFCKKLSNGENMNDLSSVSSNEDSDYDRQGNDKAFHHPFVLKDRGPIVMNIKNATPIPPKTADQTKAILLQFPVSSGQQHRLNENEWVPVPVTKHPRPEVVSTPVVTVTKPSVPKNVFQKTLPLVTQQPAFVPTNQPSLPLIPVSNLAIETPVIVPPVATVPTPLGTLPFSQLPVSQPPVSLPVGQLAISALSASQLPVNAPDVTLPPVAKSIFPEADKNVDITSVISKRLNAMRKLQENPTDTEALNTLYHTQKDMSSWATSKTTPGQFTGSTGANILSARELTSGQQAWAKRDQLITSTPVSGGMGMHLLKKMGWKPGEGLGKAKNGSLQPLLLEVKTDKRGLVTREEDTVMTSIPLLTPIPPKMRRRRPPPPSALVKVQLKIDNKHPVSLLAELAGKRKWSPPAYELVNEDGPSHKKSFVFRVILNGMIYQPSITCNTKKDAKALAAKYCLQQIGILPT